MNHLGYKMSDNGGKCPSQECKVMFSNCLFFPTNSAKPKHIGRVAVWFLCWSSASVSLTKCSPGVCVAWRAWHHSTSYVKLISSKYQVKLLVWHSYQRPVMAQCYQHISVQNQAKCAQNQRSLNNG